jgi:hypothetical protein
VAREQAIQAAHAAQKASGKARVKAAPKVEAAVDWASPRIEKGLQAAGPKVEAAADRVAPAVDAARDKIVDDLLPRIVDVVNAAATAGLAAQRQATERVSSSVEDAALRVAAATPTAKARRRSRRMKVLLVGGFAAAAAAAAAGAAALQRSRNSGWESTATDEPAFTGATTPTPTPSTLTSSTGDWGSESTSGSGSTADIVVEAVSEEPLAEASVVDDAAAPLDLRAPLKEPTETVEIIGEPPAELAEAEPTETASETKSESTTEAPGTNGATSDPAPGSTTTGRTRRKSS